MIVICVIKRSFVAISRDLIWFWVLLVDFIVILLCRTLSYYGMFFCDDLCLVVTLRGLMKFCWDFVLVLFWVNEWFCVILRGLVRFCLVLVRFWVILLDCLVCWDVLRGCELAVFTDISIIGFRCKRCPIHQRIRRLSESLFWPRVLWWGWVNPNYSSHANRDDVLPMFCRCYEYRPVCIAQRTCIANPASPRAPLANQRRHHWFHPQ